MKNTFQSLFSLLLLVAAFTSITPALAQSTTIKLVSPPLYLLDQSYSSFVDQVACTAANYSNRTVSVRMQIRYYDDDSLNVVDGMPKLSRPIKRTVDLAPGEVTSVNWGGLTSLDALIATCHFTYTGKAADIKGAIIIEDSINGRGALSLPAQLVQL